MQRDSRKAIIYRDPKAAPVLFAAQDIRTALEETGFTVTAKPLEKLPDKGESVRIVLAVKDRKDVTGRLIRAGGRPLGDLKPEGYALRTQGGSAYWAIGADETGTMYGGLHVAELVRLKKSLDAIADTVRNPAIGRRGIKFNIPLDARTPSYDDSGDAAQKNYAEMWNFAFWREFLDDMARYRYNTLTLWNPHPFPSIVKLPDYPDVALQDVCVTKLKVTYKTHREWTDPKFRLPKNLKVVKKMSMDEKIEFWRRVMRHAKDRGIGVYFITWNVFVDAAEGKYGITAKQDNPRTIAYLRQCVRETALTYPLLAGIGVTAGERMQHRRDEFSKEKWLWKAYGMGVMDARQKQPRRTVRFIHRFWQSGVDQIVREFQSKYPDPFELSFKYARARLYASTKPPFADGLYKELKAHKLKCWWNLRNDDIFNFRWGDPDYVREFLLNFPANGLTAGYHMGSDGYVWGREFTSRQPEKPRALQIRKHWYRFMLWGRLGYNPALDRGFFTRVLAARFPEAPKGPLYDAWATASKIIPLVNRFHWRNWDFMWSVEGCMDRNKGFHTVDDFIQIRPMERSGLLSVPQYVDGHLAGTPVSGTTPIQVADELGTHARDALKLLTAIRRRVADRGRELDLTLSDIEAMAHLGNYYSAKILGAVDLCAFRKSGRPKRKQAAIGHLREAVKHWQDYAAVAGRLYSPQLLARTRRLDWTATLDEVKKDLEIAQRATAQ